MLRQVNLCASILVFGLLLGLLSPSLAQDRVAEDTSPVPWKLDFEVEKFAPVHVRDRAGRVTTSWYLAFKLANPSGREVPLSLHFVLETDTGKKYREGFYPAAEERVEKRLGKQLASARERPDTIEDGEELHGIAVFGPLDPNLDRIDIEVTGLTDVVYRVGTKRFMEKKALVLQWARPGDEFYTHRDPVKFVKRSWKTLSGPREIR